MKIVTYTLHFSFQKFNSISKDHLIITHKKTLWQESQKLPVELMEGEGQISGIFLVASEYPVLHCNI